MDSDSENEKDFEGWEDESDEDTAVKSLFCPVRLPNVAALIQHDQQSYGFDLTKCCEAVGLEDASLIMLVNFIRSRVLEAGEESAITPVFAATLQAEICGAPSKILENEQYMRPVLQDEESSDALLYLLS
jgi:hypothetical protein